MSISLLYHELGLYGYRHERTNFQDGVILQRAPRYLSPLVPGMQEPCSQTSRPGQATASNASPRTKVRVDQAGGAAGFVLGLRGAAPGEDRLYPLSLELHQGLRTLCSGIVPAYDHRWLTTNSPICGAGPIIKPGTL
jgi:hypothetical protein